MLEINRTEMLVEALRLVGNCKTLLSMLEALSHYSNIALKIPLSFRLVPVGEQIWSARIENGEICELGESMNDFKKLEGINGVVWRCESQTTEKSRKLEIAKKLIEYLKPTLSGQALLEVSERLLWERKLAEMGKLVWVYASYEGHVLASSPLLKSDNLRKTTNLSLQAALLKQSNWKWLELPDKAVLSAKNEWTFIRKCESTFIAIVPITLLEKGFKPCRDIDFSILTSAEKQVLQAMLTCGNNQQIADQLRATRRAINRRLSSIYRKLGYESRYSLLSDLLNRTKAS